MQIKAETWAALGPGTIGRPQTRFMLGLASKPEERTRDTDNEKKRESEEPSPAKFPQHRNQEKTRTYSRFFLSLGPVRHGSSSTAALAYKALRRRSGPLPIAETPNWTAQAARHILNCLVANEPGVLSRVSGILAARGFNIDSLVVCSTEVEDLSRMTIVLQGHEGVIEQARRQLEDLELLLAKVNILGPEYFEELLAHHREISAIEPASDDAHVSIEQMAKDFHPSRLAMSEALRHKHEHLKSITYFAHQFGGKVLDISTNSCIVEVSAKPNRIDSFLKLITPFGLLESARTGLMALPRSPLLDPTEDAVHKELDEIVDASQLPLVKYVVLSY
ncbi:unnamed protein product [Parascedosporium putredinis]|uniref:ACT domain-containing protein n=1 Tax=Parascedosporium putredinis TaxID=1442378 RepID=A0A9P1M613_9PEZI|nr:unnamed protein product [Parascedosporium putredinis]CAI7988818.1 unnamed protein product [Parascedosporium putredinis]